MIFRPGDRIRVAKREDDYFIGVNAAGLGGIVVGSDPCSNDAVGCVFPGWGWGHDFGGAFPEYADSRDGQWVAVSALTFDSPFQRSVRDWIAAALS